MSLDDDVRRREAKARRDAIDACQMCDEFALIAGWSVGLDGTRRAAAAKCDHTDRPLPTGFTPDWEAKR